MISIYDEATYRSALLHRAAEHIKRHWLHAVTHGLQLLTYILLIEHGDTEKEVVAAIGFTPLQNPLTGLPIEHNDFEPHWSWLQGHGQWLEMIVTVGDSGFAYILLIERGWNTAPDAICDGSDHP